jgi:hypothetical protein
MFIEGDCDEDKVEEESKISDHNDSPFSDKRRCLHNLMRDTEE